MNTLMMFDYNGLLFKAVNIHKNYTFGGRYTGGIYGFVNQMCKSINTYKPSYIVICNDQPPYKRRELYPDYKANRNKDEEITKKLQQSRELINEFLYMNKIPLWSYEGLEADDLFAILCDTYHDSFEKIIIVSSDDDLYELLKYENVYLSKEGDLYSQDDFCDDFRIEPKDWPMILSMSGTHNNIKGLKGIGRTTALKLWHGGGCDKVWEDNKNILEFYYNLIKLPFHTSDYEVIDIPKSKFDLRLSVNFLARLGIDIKSHMYKTFEYLEEGGKYGNICS